MSTDKEKREAIAHAVEVAKKRLVRLDALKAVGALTKAQEYEREGHIDLIRRGQTLLATELAAFDSAGGGEK